MAGGITFKSGDNLEKEAINFIASNEEVILFSAYIKTNELEKINKSLKIKQIIVRWGIQDLCVGASDFECLWKYCDENKIKLFRNTRLHMKVFWNNKNDIVFGSANVTNLGLGEIPGHNYELNGKITDIQYSDIKYLKDVINSDKTEYIDKKRYEEIKEKVDQHKEKAKEFEKIPEMESKKNKEKDNFLISQLPMSKNISKLYDKYIDRDTLDQEELHCLIHDLSIYQIDENLDEETFKNTLKESFNNHPFIQALKDEIKKSEYKGRKSMHFGGIQSWIERTTTTVPTPRRWEIQEKEIVNILFEWICEFDKNFTWDDKHSNNRGSSTIYYQSMQKKSK